MANRLFVTGDTHGDYDIGKLSTDRFDSRKLDKDDYLIVAGDFGLVFHPVQSTGREEYWLRWLAQKPFTTLFVDGNHENFDRLFGLVFHPVQSTGREEYWLRWLAQKPFTTLFVDGNHENFDRLNEMPVEMWHGGRVHRINDSVLHLMRGEAFDIAGRKVFCMGGARSHDIEFRTEGESWWPQEMPDADDRAHAWETLDAMGWKADLVITHCAPANFQHALRADYGNDEMTRFLFDVERKLEYGRWFFGHYHEDKEIGERARAIYDDVVEVLTNGSVKKVSRPKKRLRPLKRV